MSKKGGLGRGLDSLIPQVVSEENKKQEEETTLPDMMVKIHLIEPNRDQPRKVFDEEGIAELAESIKQYGIIQPLVVQKKDDYYEIIAGERRWRAAKLAGLKQVPVIVRDYSEQEIMEISLIENIQREDLNPIEEALAYQRLMTEFNLTQEEIAKKVCKSRVAITNTIRLLKLDQTIQDMLIEEQISSGHARALLAIEDRNIQYTIAQKVVEDQLSVRATEELVKKINEEPDTPKTKTEDGRQIIYRQLEDKLKAIIGTKVNIKNRKDNKGKIEIEYYSVDELERIIDLLNTVKTSD